MKIELRGTEELSKLLRKKSQVRWDAVCKKNLTEMRNRAVRSHDAAAGGTPVDTGELRKSVAVTMPNDSGFSGEIGYGAEYAPHVEFGHRTRKGGFVPGRYFLKANLEKQLPIFKQDLIDHLRKG